MAKFAPTDNYLLRVIIAVLNRIKCLLECSGQSRTTNPVDVSSDEIEIRPYDPEAKSTRVYNSGDGDAIIYEDGNPVAVAQVGKVTTLPTASYGVLTATATGDDTILTVLTQRRCACAQEEYVPVDAEPIGAHLL